MRAALFISLVCCLLVTLVACGNKGPLIAAEDDQPKKNEPTVVE
jgi:predicted small lipoprotein YifL